MAEQSTESNKKTGYTNWVAIIIGLIMVFAGTFAWLGDDEETNNALIQSGTAQTCVALVSEYPNAKPHLNKLADALDAAIEARAASPDQLANIISSTLSELTGQGINVDALVRTLVAKVNKAYAVSETEEQYLHKVQIISHGIRDSIG